MPPVARRLLVIKQPWSRCDGVDPEGNIIHLIAVKPGGHSR